MCDKEIKRLLVHKRTSLDRIIEIHGLRLLLVICRPGWQAFSVWIAGCRKVHPKRRHIIRYLVVSGCPGPVFQVQVIEDVDQVDRVIGPQLRGWAFTEGRSRRKRRQLAEQIQIRFALACLGLQVQPIALAGSVRSAAKA